MIISFDDYKALNRKSKNTNLQPTPPWFPFTPSIHPPLKQIIQPLLIYNRNIQAQNHSAKSLSPVTRRKQTTARY